MQDFKPAVEVLDQGGAAFDPVAVVAVEDAVDGAHFGGVDMAADDSVDFALSGLGDHRVLEMADVFDGVLDLVFQVGRQRPIAEAHLAAGPVEPGVQRKCRGIGMIADEGQPFGVFDDPVEFVAVQNEIAPAIGSDVDGVAHDRHPAEAAAGEVAEGFVMVAGDVDDAGSLARLAQKLLDDVVMFLAPIPSPLHAPTVYDVADEIEIVGLGVFQEVQQELGVTSTGTEMNVRNPDGAELHILPLNCVHTVSSLLSLNGTLSISGIDIYKTNNILYRT